MADSMAALATIHTVGKQTRRLSKLSLNDGDFSTGPRGQDAHEMKASEFLREAEASKRLVEKLQKERSLSAQCRKNGWTDISGELEEFERVLHQSRNVEKMTIQKQLEKIHNGVKKFQRQITDVKPTAELIGKLKEIMTEVEISINTFKEDHRLRFEELLKEERICYQEIAAYEKKLETWTLAIKLDPKLHPAPLVKVSKPDGDIPSEVRALESFLQKTGGPYGGWDQYDHQAFLKVWTKHSGRPAFRKEARLYLPGKSLEEIEQHKEWYQELNHLQDKKREAIQQWKASKQQERQARIQSQEEERENKTQNKTQTQQHRAEEERREAEHRLEEWREQQRKKEQQIQEQRLAEEIYQMRQAKEERRRQLEVKLAIEEQLLQRREAEEAQERSRREEEQRQLGERRKVATMGIKRFQERDLHKVEKKIQERQLSEQQEMEKQKRIAARIKEKVEVHISRNPSRLTQPTKGWEERMKHIGPSGGGPVLHMFHRAVPSWRQGL